MKLAAAVLVVLAGLGASTRTQAGEPPVVPVRVSDPRTGTLSVSDAMRALDKLRSLGYAWTSDAGALKAVKAWQRSNGLEVDGIVGPQTLASLNLPATASAPAVRVPVVAVGEPPVPAGSAESIIRAVWPDDVEDWAVKIATRESNLQPSARNSCCYGLFQIHWFAHQSWLSDHGASTPNDLLDPTVNARVALALFQQAGVGPWLCRGQCRDIPL